MSQSNVSQDFPWFIHSVQPKDADLYMEREPYWQKAVFQNPPRYGWQNPSHLRTSVWHQFSYRIEILLPQSECTSPLFKLNDYWAKKRSTAGKNQTQHPKWNHKSQILSAHFKRKLGNLHPPTVYCQVSSTNTNTWSMNKIPSVHQLNGSQAESIFQNLSFTAVRSLTHFTNQMLY